MKRCMLFVPAALALLPALALAQGPNAVRTPLSGFQEVPAIVTGAEGAFHARLDSRTGQIHFRLSYDGLEGDVVQAHIHIGQAGVNGGVAVWLCSNLASPPTPAGVPACPSPPAVVEGTITAADVVGPAGQGVAAGELGDVMRALRTGNAYVNVHTSSYPGGEIRGQLGAGRSPHH